MKHYLTRCTIIMIIQFICAVTVLHASEVFSIQFNSQELTISSQDNFDLITMRGCILDGEVGAPLLPKKRIEFIIPSTKHCVGINVIAKSTHPLAGTFAIYPTQPPVALNGEPIIHEFTIDEEIYARNALYPDEHIEFLQESHIAGSRIVTIYITPLAYIPRNGQLFLLKEITFELLLEDNNKEVLVPEKRSSFSHGFFTDLIRKRVQNKNDVNERIANCEVISFNHTSPSITAKVPSQDDLPCDMLIITDDYLLPAFEDYAMSRANQGIIAIAVSKEWIIVNYSGRDVAERIRNFIKDAYLHWGIIWVLLGGDITVVPTRFAHYNSWQWNGGMPTDLYYSDLDGDWDADGDGLFGEVQYSCNVDSVEGSPDVFVGRLPVETSAEAYGYFSRVETYEKSIDCAQIPRVLFLGASIYSGGYDGWGALASECIINDYLSSNMQPYRMYAPKTDTINTPPRWDGDEELNRMGTIARINDGYNLINHLDHGAYDAFGTGVMSGGGYLHWHDADGMTNATRPSILWSISCNSNSFDLNTVSEHFINSSGGIAYIGNSRSGWTSQLYQDYAFFSALFQDSITNIGAAHAATLYNSLYNQMSMNLLGDPSICVWTDIPAIISISFPKTIHVPANSIPVLVEKNGAPLENARVVLTKSDEGIVRISLTNEDGIALISVGCTEPGTAQLSATATNCLPSHDSLTIFSPPFPYLSLDDSLYLFRAGSNHSVNLLIRNSGSETALKVQTLLIPMNPYITLSETLLKCVNIPPHSSVYSPLFMIRIDKNCPTKTQLAVICSFSNHDNRSWLDTVWVYTGTDSLAYQGHVPSIHKSDPSWISAESITIPSIFVRNLGDFEAHRVTAKLKTENQNVTIHDSIALFESILPGAMVSSNEGFSYDVRNGSHVDFTLEISDGSGYFITRSIDLDAPCKVSSIHCLPKEESVKISWTKPNSNDILGYYLYKQRNEEWKSLSGDVITKESYEDVCAAPGIPGSYYIIAIDSSYNESPASDIFTASSNPPILSGWPAYVGPGGIAVYEGRWFYDMSSPASGDIDGDGRDEIVVGSNDCLIYAFNHDGTRVSGWPLNIGFRIENSPAIYDLDHDGSDEIVIGGGISDSVSVYIFKGDGSTFMPGKWPKTDGGYPLSSPIISDIDDDGEMEIGIGCSNKCVYFWHIDGTPVFGWPKQVWSPRCIGVADLDNDSSKDIIVASANGDIDVFDYKGNAKPGWPQTVEGAISSGFSLADLDGDGVVEIILGTNQKKLYVFQHDGTVRCGWPITVSEQINCIPAIGDLNGDQVPEIVVSTRKNHFYAFKHSGGMLFSIKEPNQANNYYISPVLVDLDNDGNNEILFSTLSGYIYAYDENGEYAEGFPMFVGDGSYATAAIVDIDRDGTLNIILKGSDYRLYVWDLPTVKPLSEAHWYRTHANNRNTCFYNDLPQQRLRDYIASESAKGNQRIFFMPSPNPFANAVVFHFNISKNSKSAQLLIFDVTGRLIKKLIIEQGKFGTHQVIQWDGKARNGSDVSSGIYFAKLIVQSENEKKSFVRKMAKMN